MRAKRRGVNVARNHIRFTNGQNIRLKAYVCPCLLRLALFPSALSLVRLRVKWRIEHRTECKAGT